MPSFFPPHHSKPNHRPSSSHPSGASPSTSLHQTTSTSASSYKRPSHFRPPPTSPTLHDIPSNISLRDPFAKLPDYSYTPPVSLRARLAALSTSSLDLPTDPFPSRLLSDAEVTSDLDYPLPSLSFSPPSPAAQDHPYRLAAAAPVTASGKMRPLSNVHSTPSDAGYETGPSAPNTGTFPRPRRSRPRPYTEDILEEETSDFENELPRIRMPAGIGAANRSSVSLNSKNKADKVLGLESNAKLASFYLVSGAAQNDPAKWVPSDNEALRAVAFDPDSLHYRFRPEIHGNVFSGAQTEQFERYYKAGKSLGGHKWADFTKPMAPGTRIPIPDAGPDAAWKILAKSLKHAHPKDIEITNSTLAPPISHHTFSFTIPRHDSMATAARNRLNSTFSAVNAEQSFMSIDEQSSILPHVANRDVNIRSLTTATELHFYGVTLTIWIHADKPKSTQLTAIRERIEEGKANMDTFIEGPLIQPLEGSMREKFRRRRNSPFLFRIAESDAGSETEGNITESEMDGPTPIFQRAMRSATNLEGVSPMFEGPSDVFWMPYCLTLVSRYPIYDTMTDYLRGSWARFGKNARAHMLQVARILNMDPPRPGTLYSLPLETPAPDPEDIAFEATFPGAMDFDKGLVKVDFQLWPLFQAVDLDNILTCVEVALSHSGRVIFCSKFGAMLAIAVNTLKYIVDMRGWDGICIPMMHARDSTFAVEDPGPYIIGMLSESRCSIHPPAEAIVIDIDNNALWSKTPPAESITPRPRREKIRAKIMAAFGPGMPMDKSIPLEFKLSYATRNTRFYNKTTSRGGLQCATARIKAPDWWKQEEILAVFDKVMLAKHKKPSLIKRLTRTGARPVTASLGEQLVKTAMRKRALHYVETRDNLDRKVAGMNERYLHLAREHERYRKALEIFEAKAETLAGEAAEIHQRWLREQAEAQRLSAISEEKSSQNVELEEKLMMTEKARAEAMRKLSDMHHSIQELEKEREEIMNVIESQITSAIEGYRSDTPAESTNSCPKVYNRGLRPGTAQTQNSSFSTFTVETNPVSVLGMVQRNRHASWDITIGSGDLERAFSTGEGIASRIMSIQAKLDFALSSVGHGQPLESAADLYKDVEKAPAEQPKSSDTEQEQAQEQGKDHQKETAVDPADTTFGPSSGDTPKSRPLTSSSLLPSTNGSAIRLRPKRRSSGGINTSAPVSRAPTPTPTTTTTTDSLLSVPGVNSAGSISSQGEVLLSPAESRASFGSDGGSGGETPLKIPMELLEDSEKDAEEDKAEKRLSVVTTSTLTFGE